MKILFYKSGIALILFLPLFSQAQKQKQNNIKFEIGGYYSWPVNKKRIEYELPQSQNGSNDFVSFRSYASFSYNFGILYQYKFVKKIFIEGGLLYFRRSNMLEGIPDTIIKYSHNPYPIIKRKVIKDHLEIPILLGYIIKNTTIEFGAKFTLFETITYKDTFLDGKTKKTNINQFPDELIYPTIAVDYTITKLKFNPYFSFEIEYRIKDKIVDFGISIGLKLIKY